MRAIYGHDEAATLLSCPTTKLIMRTDEPETAEWCSRQIGAREVVHDEIGSSTGPRQVRDGFNLQPRRGTEPAVAVGEIQKMAALTGYLCITGHDRARVTFPYLQPVKRQAAFIARSQNPGATMTTVTVNRRANSTNNGVVNQGAESGGGGAAATRQTVTVGNPRRV